MSSLNHTKLVGTRPGLLLHATPSPIKTASSNIMKRFLMRKESIISPSLITSKS